MSRSQTLSLRWILAVVLVVSVVVAIGDPATVATTVLASGWGVLAISLYRLLPLACDAWGWRSLFVAGARPRPGPMLLFRWIGESVNTLLPVAQIGGDVARARLLSFCTEGKPEAAASVLADFTVGLVAQAVFTGIGVALLATLVADVGAVWSLVGLTAVAAAAFIAFLVVQRHGAVRRLGSLARRLHDHRVLQAFAAGAERVDAAVQAFYGRPDRLAACALWRLVGWFVRSGETWLALAFLGHPVGWAVAVVIEGLSNAARSAGFAVPAAAGIQEGGIVAVGLLVGLDVDTALALALMKRLREVLVSGPGLAAWWMVERRQATAVAAGTEQPLA